MPSFSESVCCEFGCYKTVRFPLDKRMMAKYLKPDLLIIDDMGIKQLPKRSGEYLFEIIMRRYETKSTIMTSNRPLEDWGKLLGDVPLGYRDPRSVPPPRRDHHHYGSQLPAQRQSRK